MTRLEFLQKEKSKQPSFYLLNDLISDGYDQQLHLSAQNTRKIKGKQVIPNNKLNQKSLNARKNSFNEWLKLIPNQKRSAQMHHVTPKKIATESKSLNSKMSTRERTITRPLTSFQKGSTIFLTSESEQYKKIPNNLNQSDSMCRQLAYMNGYLRAEVEQKKRELWTQKQKHVKQVQYLIEVAQKYREKAKKYKRALLQNNQEAYYSKKHHSCKKKGSQEYSLLKQCS